MCFQTEFEFTLPVGYVDKNGELHREGVMRRSTAADEILPLKDLRVRSNPAYRKIIILSRVITKLDGLPAINPRVIEGLYAEDLAYLQELYGKINGKGASTMRACCPHCGHSFAVETPAGE